MQTSLAAAAHEEVNPRPRDIEIAHLIDAKAGGRLSHFVDNLL